MKAEAQADMMQIPAGGCPSSPEAQGKAWNRFSLKAAKTSQSWRPPHLDSWPPAPGENDILVLSQPGCGIILCHSCPRPQPRPTPSSEHLRSGSSQGVGMEDRPRSEWLVSKTRKVPPLSNMLPATQANALKNCRHPLCPPPSC